MSDPTTFVPVRRLISDPGFVPASPWIATDASRNYNRRTPYWYQPRGTLAPYQFGVHGLGACCTSCAQGKACEGQAAGCLGGVPVRVQDLGAFDFMSIVSSAQSHTQGYAVPVTIGATVGYLADKKSGLLIGAVVGAALKYAYGRYVSPVVSSMGVDGFRDDIRFNPAMSPLDSPLDRSAFRFLQLILLTGVTTLAVKVVKSEQRRLRKARKGNGRRRNSLSGVGKPTGRGASIWWKATRRGPSGAILEQERIIAPTRESARSALRRLVGAAWVPGETGRTLVKPGTNDTWVIVRGDLG